MNVRNFVNDMFGELKVFLDENGQIWFYGVEVAKTLDFGDPAATISKSGEKIMGNKTDRNHHNCQHVIRECREER
ncbi:MAG: hypothetical protein SPL63_11895 [Roseburia faecis]|nr:hypothetical protein [Roseburia faecis]